MVFSKDGWIVLQAACPVRISPGFSNKNQIIPEKRDSPSARYNINTLKQDMKQFPKLDLRQAQTFLKERFNVDPVTVEFGGEGAWSQCFGFRLKSQDLVIRFGHHVDDFQKDRIASSWIAPGLPIPEIIEIGQGLDCFYAISTRVRGAPLESTPKSDWQALVPAAASALEALRLTDLSATQGFGAWGADGNARFESWHEYLLSVGDDTPDKRTHGWRERLARHVRGRAAFAWGFDLLTRVASEPVPRCLIHGDLLNRNVLVGDRTISGVFDWGCSAYGDHLYDLAWFEFWAPWHPNLSIDDLKAELENRWRTDGSIPVNKDTRLLACYLHIGLDHLAYNAFIGDKSALSDTAERMMLLVGNI
jgi:hygromycin-B 4-O-kinase